MKHHALQKPIAPHPRQSDIRFSDDELLLAGGMGVPLNRYEFQRFELIVKQLVKNEGLGKADKRDVEEAET